MFHQIVASGEQVVDDLVHLKQRLQLNFDRSTLVHLLAGEIEKAVHDYAEAGRLADQFYTLLRGLCI